MKRMAVVSGGRLGAERAALDWAIGKGLDHRGWCPVERRSEEGPIPIRYRLRETDSTDAALATEWNVRDSEGTVLFSLHAEPCPAARRVIQFAEAMRKPWIRLHHATPCDPPTRLASFLRLHQFSALHVTGSTALREPGICDFVNRVLDRAYGIVTEGIAPEINGAGARADAALAPLRSIPVLNTARLVLRPFSAADAACVQRFLGDPALVESTVHLPHPYPPDEAAHWIAGHADLLEEGVWHWAVTLTAGVLVGAVSLFVSPAHGRATVGYWIGREHHGQGFAVEALRRVIGFAFAHLKLHRVEGAHLDSNPEAGRVMEAAGMHLEGRLRGHVLHGRRHEDVAIYGILNPLCDELPAPPAVAVGADGENPRWGWESWL